MSPRILLPSLMKTAATREIYPGLGSLFTRCWISCWQTNGGRLGCWKILVRAPARSSSAVWPAGKTVPFNRVFGFSSCSDSTATRGW